MSERPDEEDLPLRPRVENSEEIAETGLPEVAPGAAHPRPGTKPRGPRRRLGVRTGAGPTTRARALWAGGALLIVLVGGLALASRGGALGLLSSRPSGIGTPVPVIKGDLIVRVRAKGELEAVKAYPVAVPPVPTGALKVAKLVPEGSVVKQGDTLVEFDASQLEIELDNNLATLKSTGRRIDKNRIQSAIEAGGAEAMKTVASLELDVAESVTIDDQAIYSRREILDAALDKKVASKRIVFADLSLLLKGKYYDIDEGILQVQKKSVADRIGRVKTSLATLVLKSPGAGMVVYRKNWRGGVVSVGNSVWPGNVLMSLVDPAETALKVYVPEKYATGLEAGQRASVRVDAFSDRTYTGKLRSISKLSRPISQASPVKYFEAQIGLDTPDPERLKPGMAGEAEIYAGEATPGALVVPRAAIHGTDGGAWVFAVGPDGGPVKRTVTLGAGDLVRVRVTSGLQEGDAVFLGGESSGKEAGEGGAGGSAKPAAKGGRASLAAATGRG